MFQEYINNVISSSESTRGFVMITLRAKMRFYISVTIQYEYGTPGRNVRFSPHFDGPLSRVRLIPVLLRFTEIYYLAVSARVLSAT